MEDKGDGFPAGMTRVVIENVTPELDAGHFAIKRTVGEKVMVEADIFADGHDVLTAMLKFRHKNERDWTETPMEFQTNDHWRGEFTVHEVGTWLYTIEAWVDHFKSWRRDLKKRIEARQDVSVDLLAGAQMVEAAAERAKGADAEKLAGWAKELGARETANAASVSARALDPQLADLTAKYPDRHLSTEYGTSFFRGPQAQIGMARSRIARRNCRALREWVLIFSICRRFIRLANPSGRERTTIRSRNRAIPEVRGR